MIFPNKSSWLLKEILLQQEKPIKSGANGHWNTTEVSKYHDLWRNSCSISFPWHNQIEPCTKIGPYNPILAIPVFLCSITGCGFMGAHHIIAAYDSISKGELGVHRDRDLMTILTQGCCIRLGVTKCRWFQQHQGAIAARNVFFFCPSAPQSPIFNKFALARRDQRNDLPNGPKHNPD